MGDDAAAAFAAAIADAPTTCGVYYFLGDGGALLYIGKGANLRRRLRDHAKNATTPRLRAVREIRWESSPSSEAALARESNLIAGLRPPGNRTFEGTWLVTTFTGPAGQTAIAHPAIRRAA